MTHSEDPAAKAPGTPDDPNATRPEGVDEVEEATRQHTDPSGDLPAADAELRIEHALEDQSEESLPLIASTGPTGPEDSR